MQLINKQLSRLYRTRIRLLPLSDFERLFVRVEPYTMLGVKRLKNIYNSVSQVIQSSIPGDIVECGVARGGSTLLMALTLKKIGSRKKLTIFDSFEGMPEPSAEGDPDYEKAKKLVGACKGSFEDVRGVFEQFQVLPDIRMVKGFYQETLPTTERFPISFLHLDCDWYESIKLCLETFYDQVSPGGIIQIDDYFTWAGCKKAMDEVYCHSAT